jgi:malate synthase
MAIKQVPAKKPVSNIEHLRKILSVDTILQDINQEEALEFLDAVEADIAAKREEHQDELDELKNSLDDKFKEKDEEFRDLQKDYNELMDKTDFDLQIGTIEYRSPGIMDDMIMNALSEAYDRLTPIEIMDRLKVNCLKSA